MHRTPTPGFGKMRISTKIMLANGISILLLMIIAAFSIFAMKQMTMFNMKSAEDYESLQAMAYIERLVHEAEQAKKDFLFTGKNTCLALYHQTQKKLAETIRQTEKLLADTQPDLFSEIKKSTHLWYEVSAETMKIREEVTLITGKADNMLLSIEKLIDNVVAEEMVSMSNTANSENQKKHLSMIRHMIQLEKILADMKIRLTKPLSADPNENHDKNQDKLPYLESEKHLGELIANYPEQLEKLKQINVLFRELIASAAKNTQLQNDIDALIYCPPS